MDKLTSSFRDPYGFMYWNEGRLYRQINVIGKTDYDLLISSGLYDTLVEHKWLISHEDCLDALPYSKDKAYKIIAPQQIPYISYPYEWCLEQYRIAALLTLEICSKALECGMILKDASAYNIQFMGNKPILIDTLSFEKYEEGKPWVAYGQFCRHFLAPIALMSNVDSALSQLMRVYIDGIPLDLAAKLLPANKRLSPSYYIHIFLQGKQLGAQKGGKSSKTDAQVSKEGLLAILANLKKMIQSCEINSSKTEWGSYYEGMHNYSDRAFEVKADIVRRFLQHTNSLFVCDMGGNTGEFSKIAAEPEGAYVVCYDIDHTAVNRHYSALRKNKTHNILPLLLDLANPSPALGWANIERDSLAQRSKFDCMLALALVHHLAISNNVPLSAIARYFAGMAKHIIIEFVPKEDSQVQKLLSTREDIFPEYKKDCFEKSFTEYFEILKQEQVVDSTRVVYLMKSRLKG